jgi:hypothetical protein
MEPIITKMLAIEPIHATLARRGYGDVADPRDMLLHVRRLRWHRPTHDDWWRLLTNATMPA